jgi:hypothetical protein
MPSLKNLTDQGLLLLLNSNSEIKVVNDQCKRVLLNVQVL